METTGVELVNPPPDRALRSVPGPAPRTADILGRVRYGLNFLLDPMGFVGGRFARYGDAYFVGAEHDAGLFVLRHPDHLHQVLVERAKSFEKKHSAFAVLSEVLGDGLLTTDGEVWRRQRRLVQPAFAAKRLEGYAEAMVAETVSTLDGWTSGETRDVAADMTEITLRIVTRTLFGARSGDADIERVRSAMGALQRSLLGLGLPLPRWASPAYWRIQRATAALDTVIARYVADRRRAPLASERPDLLQMLIDARDPEDASAPLSDREIRDQLITLFLAGHETTANAMAWTFHLLGENPEVEQRLFAELDSVLGGRPPRYDDLAELDYTERVVNEAMRLYPPVYVIARLAKEDVEIGDFLIPQGSEVVLWVWHTHRDPRWFPEPWRMDPDRFLPERARARPRGSYLPFSHGPRACIGKRFAMIEAKLVLATIASRYRLVPDPNHPVEPKARVTLTPANGMKMTIHRR